MKETDKRDNALLHKLNTAINEELPPEGVLDVARAAMAKDNADGRQPARVRRDRRQAVRRFLPVALVLVVAVALLPVISDFFSVGKEAQEAPMQSTDNQPSSTKVESDGAATPSRPADNSMQNESKNEALAVVRTGNDGLADWLSERGTDTRGSVSLAEVNTLISDIRDEAISSSVSYYTHADSDSDQTVMYIVKMHLVTDHGTDTVTVYLVDTSAYTLKSAEQAMQYANDYLYSATAAYRGDFYTDFTNGEYMSVLQVFHSSTRLKVYLEIMSPTDGTAEFYLAE